MTRLIESHGAGSLQAGAEPYAHDLIGSGAWMLPLVLATLLVYMEFKKSTTRGKFALGLLMITGLMIILVPMFGSLLLALTMFGLIVSILESMHY
jgi:4-hydroxybenzoate polyprenyltransferase